MNDVGPVSEFSGKITTKSNSSLSNHGTNRTGLLQFNVFASNVRGLRTKSKEFYTKSSTSDYDIFALTETWLVKRIESSEYFNSNFNVFRKDRYHDELELDIVGGGVLIAVRAHYTCSEVSIPESTSIECICVKLVMNKTTDVYVFNSYIPPNSKEEIYQLHFKAIQSVNSICRASDIIILTGDFNIPHASWVTDDENSNILLPQLIEPYFAADFVNDINLLGLCQVNNIRNANDRLLDLVFTNDPINLEVLRPQWRGSSSTNFANF